MKPGPASAERSMKSFQHNEPASRHLWEITAVREFIVLLLIATSFLVLYLLRDIFLPVFLAFVFAEVFNPFVTFIERKWRWPRPLTIALILALMIAAVIGFFAWLGPVLVDQFIQLAARLPEYIRALAAGHNIDLNNIMAVIDETVRNLDPRQIFNQIFSTTGRAVGIATFIFNTTTRMLLSLALVIIYFFLFSWRFNAGLAKLTAYVPQSRKRRVFAILSRMDAAVADFFRGRLVIAIIVGIMLSVGWFFTGVPYWFFLGMLTGILNIVPYLAVITWPVAILLKYVDTLTSGAGQSAGILAILIWPSVVYIVVQFLEGWILTPWIQSGQTDMSAATVLIVVFIGGAVAGIWGLLFAIPVAACCKILLEELLLPPLRRWAATH